MPPGWWDSCFWWLVCSRAMSLIFCTLSENALKKMSDIANQVCKYRTKFSSLFFLCKWDFYLHLTFLSVVASITISCCRIELAEASPVYKCNWDFMTGTEVALVRDVYLRRRDTCRGSWPNARLREDGRLLAVIIKTRGHLWTIII